MRVARWSLLACLLLLTFPWVAVAGVNVFIGSGTIPSAATDANLLAVPADSVGDLPGPTVFASASVSGFPADGVGDVPAPAVSGSGGGSFSCTTTLSSGASLSSAVSSAAAGSTICLSAGSYTWTAGTFTKSSTTTVRPASGVAAGAAQIAFVQMFPTSRNVLFMDVTISGAQLGDTSDVATNLTFQNVTWTGCLLIYQTSTVTMNIVLDGGTANTVGGSGASSPCLDDGRIIVRSDDTGVGSGDKNLTFENMEIASQAHCTDGIQVEGEARVNILNNVFHGIKQIDPVVCSTHVDSIQFYGSDGSVVSGNYFYDYGDGIMSPDGDGDGSVITNNVFGPGDSYAYAVVSCGSDNWTVTGNVVYTGKVWQQCAADSQTPTDTTSNVALQNNVFMDGLFKPAGNPQAGTLTGVTTADHNMCSPTTNCNLAGGISTAATFAGGSPPTTFAGFALTAPTAALTGASDGGPIGIRP